MNAYNQGMGYTVGTGAGTMNQQAAPFSANVGTSAGINVGASAPAGGIVSLIVITAGLVVFYFATRKGHQGSISF